MVAVANNQKKYWEEKQDVIEKDGKSIKKIWQEKNYINWNINFIKSCLEKAKISDKVVPVNFDCENCIEIMNSEQYRLFREKRDYVPRVGDLIFLDLDCDKKIDRFGKSYGEISTHFTPAA